MSEPLIIIGTGGNAFDVLDVVDAINRVAPTWRVIGFLGDHARPGSDYLGWPVLGALGDAPSHSGCSFVSAIWNDRVHRGLHEILARTRLPRERFATVVHPQAAVSVRARLGRGVVVHHGASLGGNVAIEDHVWVGPGAIVGHDASIDTCTTLAPGAILGGGVRVARNCYVGSGALVRPQVRLGTGSLIGMGAVVFPTSPRATSSSAIPPGRWQLGAAAPAPRHPPESFTPTRMSNKNAQPNGLIESLEPYPYQWPDSPFDGTAGWRADVQSGYLLRDLPEDIEAMRRDTAGRPCFRRRCASSPPVTARSVRWSARSAPRSSTASPTSWPSACVASRCRQGITSARTSCACWSARGPRAFSSWRPAVN